MSELQVLAFIAWKMFYAVICGSIVGVEREINGASAGFKTQILICVGAMLFTAIPQLTSVPSTNDSMMRLVAQIISGVGFLGAGAILHSDRSRITGLTTAAWIWFTAAIGILIGIEHGLAATFTCFSLVCVITAARKVERTYFRKTMSFQEKPDNPKE